MKDSEDVQKLLRLKRYESPGEEYFQQFAEDFKDRQRSELLRGSARSLLFERATLWLDEMSPNRWAIPATATACAAALTVGAIFTLQSGDSGISENTIAEVESIPSTLPNFEGTTGEVIELSLPKPTSRVPGGVLQQNGSVLTAGAGRGFREL